MEGLKLHHIGMIVKSIEMYEDKMFFQEKVKEVFDPIQNAKLALYTNFSDSYIELIEPINETSFTFNSLAKYGEHMNHFCYEVANESSVKELVKKYNLLLFKGPLDAVLFDNRQVYFAMDKNKNIVEFVI